MTVDPRIKFGSRMESCFVKNRHFPVSFFGDHDFFHLSESNVSWTSLRSLMKCTFSYYSRSSALFKSQLLNLIRIELININFNIGFNNCQKSWKPNSLTRDSF